MTNPILNNYIGNEEVILWQYDKAVNLINLIAKWNGWAKVSCEDFWNYFGNKMFPINQADTYGLNVWGNLLGIPRPTIKIPLRSDLDEGGVDYVTVPTGEESSDDSSSGDDEFDEYGYNSDGYRVSYVDEETGWKIVTIKNELYRGLLKGRYFLMCHTPTVPNYNRYLSIVFGAFRNPIYPDEDSSASEDADKKNGERKPTSFWGGIASPLDKDTKNFVNYKQSGAGAASDAKQKGGEASCPKDESASRRKFSGESTEAHELQPWVAHRVYRDIFDAEGNVKKYEGDDSDSSSESYDVDEPLYLTRNIAIDYLNMTMSFTFPKDATQEEAYLIFQHYDIVYPFPAGIRYPGEFLFDDLVIGLNTDQEQATAENQNYKNFVDGLVLAEDPKPDNPNGGIFSTTNRANYKVPSTVAGTAYIYQAEVQEGGDATVSITFSSIDRSKRQAVWIDWGNGQCGYYYLPAGADNPNNQQKQIDAAYKLPGLYPIIVLFDTQKVDLVDKDFDVITQFELCGGAT